MNRTITDVIIHTKHSLSEQQLTKVCKTVYRNEGVISCNRNAVTPHCLMLVYNPAATTARNVLDSVTGMGIQASLVGI
jgi:hypothetical protein